MDVLSRVAPILQANAYSFLKSEIYPFLSIYQYEIIAHHREQPFNQLIAIWLVLFTIAYFLCLYIFSTFTVHSRILGLSDTSFEKIEEWANRCVSNVNSFYAVYTFLVWFVEDVPIWARLYSTPDEYGFNSSYKRDYSIGSIIAYLWFDLARTIFYNIKRRRWLFISAVIFITSLAKSDGISMIIHHVICSFGFFLGVHYQFGVLYLAFMVQNEISTPFLNFRFFMAELGMKKSLLYLMNDISFCVMFFLDRIILNSLLFLNVDSNIWFWDFQKHGVPVVMGYLLFILGHCHMILQLYWMAKIIRMVYRKLSASADIDTPVIKESSIILQNEKCARLLGIPSHGGNLKIAKRLDTPVMMNGKAARTLGLESDTPMDNNVCARRAPRKNFSETVNDSSSGPSN